LKDCRQEQDTADKADGDKKMEEVQDASTKSERRGPGRRATDKAGADATDRRNGWDRRRGPGRRRSDMRRSAEEGEMDDEQFAFIMAIDEYKRANNRPFPSYTEILEIAKALGYRKVAEPQPLKSLGQGQD